MTSSRAAMAIVQLAALLAATPQLSAEDYSYQELNTLNVNLEPSRGYNRGDGFIYGATSDKLGGNGGMIYRLAPGQPVEVLHKFPAVAISPSINDGGAGRAHIMTVGPDGAFYGITETGGPDGLGVIFRYAIDGTFSIIDSPRFGGIPRPTSLVVTAAGDIYGTSYDDGGVNGGGSLFRRSADGSVAILHSFTRPELPPHGQYPIVRPRDPVWPPPLFDPPIGPIHPSRLCEGPDGKLYGVSVMGGTRFGTFFSFDVATNTLEVLADFGEFLDNPRYMIPTEGGFHVVMASRVLHISYDGTVEVEVDRAALQLPSAAGMDFRGIVETADGVFVEARYGGANDAGYVVRYRHGEGASIVYNYPLEHYHLDRAITSGSDGKIYGLIGYPEGWVPPAPATAATVMSVSRSTNASSSAQPMAAKKPVSRNPKSFRFRKPGDSLNLPPFARPDSAWLPAKASKTGTREVIVNILANDKDPDLQPLNVTSVTSHGTASATLVQTKQGPRLKVVTTEANPASQMVTYQLSDGNGGTSTGTVAVFSPIAATFSGTVLPALAGLPAGNLSVKISGRNIVTATFTLAGKKFTGSGTLGLDETTDIQLKLRGQSPIALRADLIRSGASPQLDVFLPSRGTVYSATLPRTSR